MGKALELFGVLRARSPVLGRPKKSEHRQVEPLNRRMKRKRSNVNGNFSSYLFRVLKQIHPQLSMTNKAMKVMDDFMHDIFHRLASEAAGLVKLANRSTLTSAEIQTSTRLILPGELSKHAVMEATKALATFIRSRLSSLYRGFFYHKNSQMF